MELESNMTDKKVELLKETDNNNENSTEVKYSSLNTGRSSLTLKLQPDTLCSCPLRCNSKISDAWRKIVYAQFRELTDHATQNQYIQRHIKIKSIDKRLWKHEVIDKKIQRRVTCKYIIPVSDSVVDSYFYSKTLTYDSVKYSLDTSQDNFKTNFLRASLDPGKSNKSFSEYSTETQTNYNLYGSVPTVLMDVNEHDSGVDSRKSDISDISSPSSFNDSESVNMSPDDGNGSDGETVATKSVKYIEVCQKAFMNMYGITEKRIRWQREKLILKSRILAEKKRKELEEINRTLLLARNLGAGCQPLLALLENSDCLHLSEQLMIAIEDDVTLVNNFFHNQLWKPEDIMNKLIPVSPLDLNSLDAECD